MNQMDTSLNPNKAREIEAEIDYYFAGMWWQLVVCLCLLIAFRRKVGASLFWLGYNVYIRSPGYYIHQKVVEKKSESPSHSQESRTELCEGIVVQSVPLLSDNYGYIIFDMIHNTTILVDPCDPDKIRRSLVQLGDPSVSAILTTHKHWDHSGGNTSLLQSLSKKQGSPVPIYGSTLIKQSFCAISHTLEDGDDFQIGDFMFKALYTPGHTTTDITYLLYHSLASKGVERENILAWSLFTGDFLFSAGCGRFFECDASVMYKSMQKLKSLHSLFLSTQLRHPDWVEENDINTYIFPGHEYTVKNLQFARAMDPNNGEIARVLEHANAQRTLDMPTIPSTLHKELLINPFLRFDDPLFSNYGNADHSGDEFYISVLRQLRLLKDDF